MSYFKKILLNVSSIAIVGASSKEHRDSHIVMKFLIDSGYEIFPINPNETSSILGRKCYPNLVSVKNKIDMVDIFRNSDTVVDIAEEAIQVNAKVLWMQLNIINDKAANIAKEAGMTVVMNRCPKIELLK